MPRILWISDPHLNFLPGGGVREFAQAIVEDPRWQGFDAAVVTGDLAEFHNFDKLIERFADSLGKPVYFVLGNHDAYGGSISGLRQKAAGMKGKARWLVSEKLVQLCEGTALVGQDGWYDARFGDAARSEVVLSDFHHIKELKPVRGVRLFDKLREIADECAREAKSLIEAAIAAGNKRIVFATHVPPFWQAAWHEGQVSDRHWLPWMSSKAMGDVLSALAAAHPEVDFLVLCGHTHGDGTYQHAPNMKVLTGHSEYRDPRVTSKFDFVPG